MADLPNIPALLRELRARYGRRCPSYPTLWRKVAAGEIQSHDQGPGRPRGFKRDDIPAIAAALGLAPADVA